MSTPVDGMYNIMFIMHTPGIGDPSHVNLMFEESTLIHPAFTTVQCTAIGGESPELFNLTLWRNDELLAQVSEDHLTYTTSPGSYGTYTCGVDGVQNSSVLQERGKHVTTMYAIILNTVCLQ